VDGGTGKSVGFQTGPGLNLFCDTVQLCTFDLQQVTHLLGTQ
jgi:hypothetical protein